jgi:hypothetical protein
MEPLSVGTLIRVVLGDDHLSSRGQGVVAAFRSNEQHTRCVIMGWMEGNTSILLRMGPLTLMEDHEVSGTIRAGEDVVVMKLFPTRLPGVPTTALKAMVDAYLGGDH